MELYNKQSMGGENMESFALPETINGRSCNDCWWRGLKCAECDNELSKWEPIKQNNAECQG